jgi:integrase
MPLSGHDSSTSTRRSASSCRPADLVECRRGRPPTWAPSWTLRPRIASALYELLALTGLRRGEALGLRWQDVDPERAVLVVRRQLVDNGGDHVMGPPKTHSGERRVDLDSLTVRALTRHRKRQSAEDPGLVRGRPRAWPRLHPRGRQPARPGLHLEAHAGDRQACGPAPKRLHDLRHGAASLQLAAGVPMAVVSKGLGHSALAITADTYAQLLEGWAAKRGSRGRDGASCSQAAVP